VRWVWSPYFSRDNCTAFGNVYPDAYVDWVALDGYNWGTVISGTRWQ
jgi:beta-mannanase